MGNNGLFITFEGSEGCGKSTQVRRLAERLEVAGRRTLVVREPGGTAVGERVRELVQFAPEGGGLVPEAELLLFAASRAQLVRESIAPALQAGRHVVADRFLDSTTVYQGFARGLGREAVAAVNRVATGGLLPDVTFLLDMDSAAARARAGARAGGRSDRMEREPEAFYQLVREGYLELAAREPGRFVVLDGARREDDLCAEVWGVLKARFRGVLDR
jgi:dTMP kinase